MIAVLDRLIPLWRSARFKKYFIKPDYSPRTRPQYSEDLNTGIIHQPDVYPFVSFLGEKFGCRYVIDVGCGNGYKLSVLHPKFEVIGIDLGTNIKMCSTHYDFGTWIEHDLDIRDNIDLPEHILESSIIVCSDIIEHLKEPGYLLSNIQRWMNHSPVCIITTPERDLVGGCGDMGPPVDPSHVREWNIREFEKLLAHFRLNVQFIGLTINNIRDKQKRTIISILHKNNESNNIDRSNVDRFKVTALMTTYNEEDIIRGSVLKLKEQGIDVYIIDNWSTDSTYNILKELGSQGLLKGMERFPESGPSPYFELKKLLGRVEELTKTLDSDWFIHHDVDEVRESPWRDISLKTGIFIADRMGYNAIDHSIMTFKPIDNGFTEDISPERYFKYFEWGDLPSYFVQIKAWKNLKKPIDLASSGGHDVRFENRKIFPYKFLLKHYPIRSQVHGEKKIFYDRKSRWSPEERNIGWHVHYDVYDRGCSFLTNASDLIYYDREKFHEEYLIERLSGIGVIR